MGEVYRASDTRLNRVVAIKVLPAQMASDPTRRERFDREARAVSSLSHPHICAVFDVGHQDGIDFLVMEYCEGETLTERLAKRPIPLDQVLRLAIDVAEALDTAHRYGIIHRDLKPSNIMLAGSGAKLLDFGVAKWRFPGPFAGVELPTVSDESKGLTAEGTLVGTLNYMAPEQLEGREVDSRADIFAFGAVLYEMATGHQAFAGTSRASVIAAVLEREPTSMRSVEPLTPPALERLVQKCLAKDPNRRWQTARDLADELRWIAENDPQVGAPALMARKWTRRVRVAWLAAGLLLLLTSAAILTLARSYPRTPPVESRLMRFVVAAPDGVQLFDAGQSMAVSPDGRYLAFIGSPSDGSQLLWIRSLDSNDARALPGTDGAFAPFWSADSRFLGFTADKKLKKVPLSGGPTQTLCDAPGLRTGTWNRDDLILFTPNDGLGIHRVSASGGAAVPVTTLDQSRGDLTHSWAEFLPDGRHFLYRIKSTQPDRTGIYVTSLDSPISKRLLDVNSNAMYAPPGYLLFTQDGRLVAQPFDTGDLRLAGEPVTIADHVLYNRVNGRAIFGVSQSGVLAYRTAGMTRLVWFSRDGQQLRAVGPPGDYADPALSPDERRVAVARLDPRTATPDIWLIDNDSGGLSQFTFDASSDVMPVWSADGREIIFASNREGTFDVYRKESAGTVREQELFKSGSNKYLLDWSRDGRFVMYSQGISNDATRPPGLWAVPLSGDHTPLYLGRYEMSLPETSAAFSPDGRWVAYASLGNGLHIESFPSGGTPVKISKDGVDPKWSRDGKELFYLSGTQMMAVPVSTQPALTWGTPRALFTTPLGDYRPNVTSRNRYDVSADGQNFLLNVPQGRSNSSGINVVVNWTTALNPH
jgi:dipeptidyl aminopeptidase/acylaminoacyl peptidase